jgi:transposase InsO family protein
MHIFERICHGNEIEHRLTKVNHPWTNGQLERMNRTLKEATVKRYYYKTHEHLRQHLYAFVNAYNFAKRLKTFKGLTPYEFILKVWQSEPKCFKITPNHYNLGLNT